MLYLLAILLPPLAVLLAGKPISAIVMFVLWAPATALLIFPHVLFVGVAWLIVAQAKGDRRHREIMDKMR